MVKRSSVSFLSLPPAGVTASAGPAGQGLTKTKDGELALRVRRTVVQERDEWLQAGQAVRFFFISSYGRVPGLGCIRARLFVCFLL